MSTPNNVPPPPRLLSFDDLPALVPLPIQSFRATSTNTNLKIERLQKSKAHLITTCIISAVYVTYVMMTYGSLTTLNINGILSKLLTPLLNLIPGFETLTPIIHIAQNILFMLNNLVTTMGSTVIEIIPILAEYIAGLWMYVGPYLQITGSAAWLMNFIPSKNSIFNTEWLTKMFPERSDIITKTTTMLTSVIEHYNTTLQKIKSYTPKMNNITKSITAIFNPIQKKVESMKRAPMVLFTKMQELHYRLYYTIYDKLGGIMKVEEYGIEDYQKWLIGTMRVLSTVKYTTAGPTSLSSRAKTIKRLQKEPVKQLTGTVRRGTKKKPRGAPSRPVSRATRAVLKSRKPTLRRALSTAMYPNPQEQKGYRSEGKKKK